MMSKDEGEDFLASFNQSFAVAERTKERLKAERRAGLTPKQRAKKPGVRSEQINFRASKETKSLADKLAKQLNISVADLMEKLLHEFDASSKKQG